MARNIYFDHTYTLDKGHRLHKKLEKMGFTLEKKEVEHPGRAFCRFIMLQSQSPRKRTYLEFIDVRKKRGSYSKSGISFGFPGSLKRFYVRLKKEMDCQFQHKNYDWKKNSKDNLPGWNFLTFDNTGIRSYFPWLTEYEPQIGRNDKVSPPKHKNTVYKILEINMSVSQKGKGFYRTLLGRKDIIVTEVS